MKRHLDNSSEKDVQARFDNEKTHRIPMGFFSSGNRTRTCDLRVMSPTSCLLLYPALCCKDTTIIDKRK